MFGSMGSFTYFKLNKYLKLETQDVSENQNDLILLEKITGNREF